MWRDYFPNAQIVGVDVYAKDVSGSRLSFEQGDQSDPEFLRVVIDEHGPFDIIIDDGSHRGEHILASFAVLWDAVLPDVFYVIEDLETAYDPDYGGGPPGSTGTAAELLKRCVDETLYRDEAARVSPSIAAMPVHEGIAFLRKPARPNRSLY